jgi:hypothetical protein
MNSTTHMFLKFQIFVWKAVRHIFFFTKRMGNEYKYIYSKISNIPCNF